MNWKSTPQTSHLILRVPIGLSLVFIGISAYRDFAPFVANVTDSLGPVSSFGYVWAFLLPALMIFGGGLLCVGRYSFVAVLTGGTALASIPIGLILKNIIGGLPLPDMMSAAYPSIVWLMAFYLAVNTWPEMEAPEESDDK